MAEVNGYLVDLRTMPREVQKIAFEKDLVPYILWRIAKRPIRSGVPTSLTSCRVLVSLRTKN
jgi:hypothetical protein